MDTLRRLEALNFNLRFSRYNYNRSFRWEVNAEVGPSAFQVAFGATFEEALDNLYEAVRERPPYQSTYHEKQPKAPFDAEALL